MMETNKVYCEDCISGLSRLPDDSVDFVLTDPPYNVGVDYHGVRDNLTDMTYYHWCYRWVSELYRILKEGKYCIIFTGDKKLPFLLNAIMDCGFQYHHLLKWHKPNAQGRLSGTVLFHRTELAFVLSKGKPDNKIINHKQIYSDTITEINTKSTDRFGSCEHNCRRPVNLYRKIILGFSRENDIVVDAFMGTGTVAEACTQTNRRYIGFEINPRYFDIITKRLCQKTLFPEGDGIPA